jgi:hypothetical protein
LATPTVGQGQAFIWQPGSVTPVTGCRLAVDMNDLGQVLCQSPVMEWDAGRIVHLPVIDTLSLSGSHPSAINNAGVVAGEIWYPDSRTCPSEVCAFKVEKGRFDLVTKMPAPTYWATARLSNAGELLLWELYGQYTSRAFALSLVTGQSRAIADVGLGRVTAINDSGWVAGTAQGHPGDPLAMLYRPGLPGKALGIGRATGINNNGAVVGTFEVGYYSTAYFDPLRLGPFMYDGSVKLLARSALDASWVITSAIEINDGGDILAIGDNATLGRSRHYLLLRPR